MCSAVSQVTPFDEATWHEAVCEVAYEAVLQKFGAEHGMRRERRLLLGR